jgi:two-component system sensor histidine kinase AlgZ
MASQSSLDSLWTTQALAGVLIAGEAVALILALAPAGMVDRVVWFGLASLMVQWILLSTLSVIYLLRRTLSQLPAQIVAWACLGLLLASTFVVSVFSQGLFSSAALADAGTSSGFIPRVLAIALVMGLLGLAAFQNYSDATLLAVRAKQAELEALQARIHPHFLFNTLNSAAALVHARPDDAERVLLDLGDLFRAALSEQGWVPLGHELELCRRYLAIEQQRFGERLRVEWRIDEGLDALSVPLLTIQPLVENAVVHGLDERSGAKSLCVEATQTATELQVSVRNAIPRDPAMFAHNGHRIGLAGVRARIESVTGGKGNVTAGADGTDFVARIALPKAAMPPIEPDQTTTR